MKKKCLIIIFVLLLASTKTYNVNAFVGYNAAEAKGTYAESLDVIYIEFETSKDIGAVYDGLLLIDENDISVEWSTLIAQNDIGGRATVFKGTLDSPLNLETKYFVKYSDKSIILDFDTSAPLISFTNKVKNDPLRYNEIDDVYLVELKKLNIYESIFSTRDSFIIDEYIRLNVVDNRDGGLLDKIKIDGLPDLYNKGSYIVSITAVDSWENTKVKTFDFEVVDFGNETVLLENIVIVVGAFIPFAIIIGYFWKKR